MGFHRAVGGNPRQYWLKAGNGKVRLKERMPERHLLDILKNVHDWVGFTRHFGPLSGSDAKLADPVARYLLTVFGYASELGASQTARHVQGLITRQSLRRINAQHITSAKLEAALRDVINDYVRFELPSYWGSGQTAGNVSKVDLQMGAFGESYASCNRL